MHRPPLRALIAVVVPLALSLSGCGQTPAILDGDACFRHVRKLVEIGPRPSGSSSIEKARTYIESQLKELGFKPEVDRFLAATHRGSFEMFNVRCEIEGAAKGVCVLMTHYDTKHWEKANFVGANDGGSGVGVLLEIARHFSKEKPPMALRLLFVDGEETQKFIGADKWNDADALYGSRHEVERMKQSKLFESTRAVVLLDMVGDKDLSIVEETQSSPKLIEIFRDAAAESKASKHFFAKKEPVNDDHMPFINAGLTNAIDLIDFEYGPNNSYWHSVQDTLDKLSPQSLQIVGDVVLRALPKIAKQFP